MEHGSIASRDQIRAARSVRIRRPAAVLAIAVLIIGLLPPLAAFASASSTAQLTAGLNLFPGAAQNFTIRVNNTEQVLLGKPIRFVQVSLPRTAGITNSAAPITAPSGWQVQRVNSGSLQLIRYHSGTINAGANHSFTFPADVLPPLNGDQTATFAVSVSDSADGTSLKPSTATPSTGLNTQIRTLRITSVAPISPAVALSPNRDMTEGGAVVYRVRYQNLARNAQMVNTTLTGAGASDTVTRISPAGTGAVSVPGEGSLDVDYQIAFGVTGTSNRSVTLTAGGATDPVRSVIDNVSDNYQVLAKAQLTPDIGTFGPTVIQTHTPRSYTFTMTVAKAGTPALTVPTVEISFAGNTVSCGSLSFPRNNANATMSCVGTNLSGTDGLHNVTATFSGVDDNDVPFSSTQTFPNVIRIDNIAPVVTLNAIGLPNDQDGRAQTAARSGNSVTVSGTIDPGPDGSAVTLDFVELHSSAGDVQTVSVNRNGNTFSGTVTLNFPNAVGTDVHTFQAQAQVRDAADNLNTGASTAVPFDDVRPRLHEARTVLDARYSNNPAIEVAVIEQLDLRGGCDTGTWSVSGTTVSSVLYSSGAACSETEVGDPGDNIRILVLADEIDITDTPAITYEPGPFLTPVNQSLYKRLKDSAGNFADEQTIDSVVGILPPVPRLGDATRNAGAEVAPVDEGHIWTRFDGNDLQVPTLGVKPGWVVEVTDAAGTVLWSEEAQSETFTATVPVDAVAAGNQQLFTRKVRYVNSVGAGEALEFTVMVDKINPVFDTATLVDSDTVEVNFNELIWKGDASAADFFVWEHYSDPDSDVDRYYYQVDSVTGGRSATWTLEASTLAQRGPFGGVDYLMIRGSGVRLEDRAGNLLADTLSS